MTYQLDDYEKRTGRIKFIIGTQYRDGGIVEQPHYLLPEEVYRGKLKEQLKFIQEGLILRFLWVKARGKLILKKDLR